MHIPELISQPFAIAEHTGIRSAGYWIRTDRGEYMPMPRLEFRLLLRARLKAADRSVRDEGWPNGARVRCVAGLLPGVYCDGASTFLNPRFVQFVEPRRLDPPPEEFIRVRDQLGALVENNAVPAKQAELRNRLLEIYQRTHRVIHAPGIRPWRLLGLQQDWIEFPYDDHCTMFRGRQGLVWTSQPYGCAMPEIIGFARLYGLTVRISPEWSWHYPGRSLLLEWRRRPWTPYPMTGKSEDISAGLLAFHPRPRRAALPD